MTIYYIPYNFKGDYAITDSYFTSESDACSAACDWWCEEGYDHDDVDGYGCVEVKVSQSDNPYETQYNCIDDSYDCDWDSERGFYSIAPMGTGSTHEEAIKDYMDQRS